VLVRLFLVCLLFVSVSTQAATVTLDFEEDFSADPFPNSVETKGYALNSAGNFQFFSNAGESDVSLVYCPGCVADLQRSDGQEFSLESIDLSLFPGPNDVVSLTGKYSAGGSISVGLVVDEIVDTYFLGSEWSGLIQVQFGSASSAVFMDNIVVTAVPIPSAVWLLGSALAGLGWMRRKQTV